MPATRPGRPAAFRVAEFFAGIGLMRAALEQAGLRVVWANDIEPVKARVYEANFGGDDLVLGDVRDVRGADVPEVELATASFPCTDLSLAGGRRGLDGAQSGMFWEFARVLHELGARRGAGPAVVLLENVPAFASSHGGRDLYAAVRRLNQLGYSCDLLVADARWFVPQSRPRLFIVGARVPVGDRPRRPDALRPDAIVAFAARHRDLALHAAPLLVPAGDQRTLADVVERFAARSERWLDADRTARFVASLSPRQRARLAQLQDGRRTWRTAYRRTREGAAVWEIRADAVAGCLRTARGGSSKQAVVQAGGGRLAVRWMTAREYARLQGVDDAFGFAGVSANQAMYGFGDAVCVPVVAWLARACVLPALRGQALADRACG